MAEKKRKIQWHPGFYGGLELTLREYKNSLEFITEYELSKKPIRVDMLIIRKDDNTRIENKIGRLFRKHNIVEYKSPDDELTIDVFYKVIGYTGLYIGLNGSGLNYNKSSANLEIEETISFFRHRKPINLFRNLKKLGAEIEKYADGIYYISGIINIPVQIVVISELPPKEFISLRALSPKLSQAEAWEFVLSAQKLTESDDRQNIDAVMDVSIAANKRVYEALEEDIYMCKALEDLLKDKIEEKVNQSKLDGALSTLYDLVKKGLLDIKDAAMQANMTESAFTDGLKKYGA